MIRMFPHTTRAAVYLMSVLTAITVSACTAELSRPPQIEHSPSSGPTENRVPTPEPDTGAMSITIRSVGDILIHEDVYVDAANRAAAAGGGEAFDFAPMLDRVRPYLENADITTANMEVPVAGPEFELGGYPSFNAPPEVVDALAAAGVDIVNNATNHVLDRGMAGLVASTSNLREHGMPYVGSYASPEDRATPRVIVENGLKVGCLGYTYGTNGIPVPPGQEYTVNFIDPELMRADIEALRPEVDVLIVMMHAGEEYSHLPTQQQMDTADIAREAGADFILGGHPHILEPFERYPDHEPGLGVWWSHGNFLHGQQSNFETNYGGIGEYTITRHSDGQLTLDAIRFMPTYNLGVPFSPEYQVIPLADAGWLDHVDVAQRKASITELMNTYTDVEVVDYLD